MARRLSAVLPSLQARADLWLTSADKTVLGARHIAILEAARDLGALNRAARQLRMSYRDAWGKIRNAEAALGIQLLSAQAGGARGGGARLTPAAHELIARWHGLRQAHGRLLARHAVTSPSHRRAAAPLCSSERVVLASTTSLVDSGILPGLLTSFTQRAGIEVVVLSVGSGKALQLARHGDADLVLTHTPEAERQSLEAGVVVNQRAIMRNAFVLVGPEDDTASIAGAPDVLTAMRRIAIHRSPFLARADNSGTAQRTDALMGAARLRRGQWHRSVRLGMAALLRRADALGAYALTDTATFAAVQDTLRLQILWAGGADLGNVYSALAANPHRHRSNYLGAMTLIAWLTAPATQECIAAYRVGGRAVVQPVRA